MTRAFAMALALVLVPGVFSPAEDLAPYELLESPARAFHFLGGTTLLNEAEGTELVAMATASEHFTMSLAFVNPETDQTSLVTAPVGSGAWALARVPGKNMLAVGAYYEASVLLFDLDAWAFKEETLRFSGESVIWNFAAGGDGRLYFGTYPGGKLGALDPETLTLEDLGAPLPPNTNLQRVSPLPDGRILCAFGPEQPGVRVYDPATKMFVEPPETLAGVSSGKIWNGQFVSGTSAFDKELNPADPFPKPPAEGGEWSVVQETTTDKMLWLRQGNVLFRFKAGDGELTRVSDIELRGGRLVAGLQSGAVFGVRGRLYFSLDQDSTSLLRKPVMAPPPARPPLFLTVEPENNRLWGGPYFGQTVFLLDTQTKTYVAMDKVVDADGAVLDMVSIQGILFGVSEPNGDIFRLDPEASWDQYGRKNPVTIASLAARGYTRPTGGILMAYDTNLYSGWMAGPGRHGGAIAVTHPVTGATELIENPFGKQAVTGLTVDESHIYVGTSIEGNGLPNKEGESPQLGIMGFDTRQPYKNFAFPGAVTVDRLHRHPFMPRLTFTVDGNIRQLDLNRLELLPAPADPAPPVTGKKIAYTGGGSLFYASEKQIIKFNPQTGGHAVFAELPEKIGAFTGSTNWELYAACGPAVYRVRVTP